MMVVLNQHLLVALSQDLQRVMHLYLEQVDLLTGVHIHHKQIFYKLKFLLNIFINTKMTLENYLLGIGAGSPKPNSFGGTFPVVVVFCISSS